MNATVLFVAALTPFMAEAACERHLTPADKTIGHVERKIACLANEISQLENQLRAAETAAPSVRLTYPRIRFEGTSAVSDCFMWARKALTASGYKDAGSQPHDFVRWADGPSVSIYVRCNSPATPGVLVAGPSKDVTDRMADRIGKDLEARCDGPCIQRKK